MSKAKKKSTHTNKKKKSNKQSKNINKILLTIIITSIAIVIMTNIVSIISLFKTDPPTQIESIQEDTQTNTQAPITETNTTPPPTTQEQETTPSNEQSQTTSDTLTPQIELQLYFIKISEDEQIVLVPTTRKIEKTPAILTKTLELLLQGPNSQEQSNGLSHYIPSNSKLQSVSIKNSEAHLDFNEEFQFNEFGTAGTLAQLYQIVYTCTEIPTINAVKFTINNKQIKYLGGEGFIEVDIPITREYLDSQ